MQDETNVTDIPTSARFHHEGAAVWDVRAGENLSGVKETSSRRHYGDLVQTSAARPMFVLTRRMLPHRINLAYLNDPKRWLQVLPSAFCPTGLRSRPDQPSDRPLDIINRRRIQLLRPADPVRQDKADRPITHFLVGTEAIESVYYRYQ